MVAPLAVHKPGREPSDSHWLNLFTDSIFTREGRGESKEKIYNHPPTHCSVLFFFLLLGQIRQKWKKNRSENEPEKLIKGDFLR